MKGGLPERIDPLHLADHRVRLSGQLPLPRFCRLKELLSDHSGEVRFSADFTLDESGQRIVELNVAAPLTFICQRCMQPMRLDVAVESTLALVASEAVAEQLAGRYECLLVSSDRVPLVELLEDELLLRVPMIPKHEPGAACQASATGEAVPESTRRPFAALAALKDRDTN